MVNSTSHLSLLFIFFFCCCSRVWRAHSNIEICVCTLHTIYTQLRNTWPQAASFQIISPTHWRYNYSHVCAQPLGSIALNHPPFGARMCLPVTPPLSEFHSITTLYKFKYTLVRCNIDKIWHWFIVPGCWILWSAKFHCGILALPATLGRHTIPPCGE